MTTTSTIAPPHGRTRIALADLTPARNRFVVDYALEHLGTAHGLAEDEPRIPYADRTERLDISRMAAWMIGLALTDGAEIAQCYGCADIVDGADTEEDAGVIRCSDCHTTHRYADPAPYDLWADFYRA